MSYLPRLFVVGLASFALAALALYSGPASSTEASGCVSSTRIAVVNGQIVVQDQTSGDCESSSSTTVDTSSIDQSDGTSFRVLEKTTVQASKRLTKAQIIDVLAK